jgi:EF hand domain-containing protein
VGKGAVVKTRLDTGSSAVRKLAIAVAVAQCVAMASCQSGQAPKVDEAPSADRLEFVSQFKKIDAAGKGQITLEQATAHYNIVFTGLDKNGDGFLDVAELQPLLPIMGAKTAAELMAKLDRNGDNKLTRQEFLVITSWLFQLASGRTEMTLQEAEKGVPPSMREKKEPTLFGK